MDPESSWLSCSYYSGDNASCRMSSHGRVEKRINGSYEETAYSFHRKEVNKIESENYDQQNIYERSPEEEKFLEKVPEVIETVSKFFATNSDQFSGEESFRIEFTKHANKEINKIIDLDYVGKPVKFELRKLLNDAMRKVWKERKTETLKDCWLERVKCTENLENFSKPKDEG
jgi:hypothetical protein